MSFINKYKENNIITRMSTLETFKNQFIIAIKSELYSCNTQ